MIQKEGSIIGDIIEESQGHREIFQEISDHSQDREEGVILGKKTRIQTEKEEADLKMRETNQKMRKDITRV